MRGVRQGVQDPHMERQILQRRMPQGSSYPLGRKKGRQMYISQAQTERIITSKYGKNNILHTFGQDLPNDGPIQAYLVKDKGKLTYLIVDQCVESDGFYDHDEADVRARFEDDIMEVIDDLPASLNGKKIYTAVMQFKGSGQHALMRLWHLAD
jgi:hypothetical protein